MGKMSRPVRIASIALISVGAILLLINLISGGTINVALPLVFLVLGGGFFLLVFRIGEKWSWASYLYIPGMLLSTFGIIFLLNVLTRDWNSWAYAWLLLVAAAGVGMLLAGRDRAWRPVISLIGWGMAGVGITLFAVFGAITGGLFIQIIAPIILVAAGVSLRWLHLGAGAAGHALQPQPASQLPVNKDSLAQSAKDLIEPLSSRELEVLRLIDAGLSNQQIADKLSVAGSTVKTHINNIYGKLGVQTRVQAANRARELQLFDS
jgi:DNA-binding CsgD family transcriptional regulator